MYSSVMFKKIMHSQFSHEAPLELLQSFILCTSVYLLLHAYPTYICLSAYIFIQPCHACGLCCSHVYCASFPEHLVISFDRIWFRLLLCFYMWVRLCSSFCCGPMQSHRYVCKDILLEMETRLDMIEHQMLYVLSKSCGSPGATIKAPSFRWIR